VDIVPVDRVPAELRARYLDSLALPQELFVEMLVQAGTAWRVGDDGYAVVHDGRVVELLPPTSVDDAPEALLAAVSRRAGAARVLCKSFDRWLLFAALAGPAKVTCEGLMFRRFGDAAPRPVKGTHVRTAGRGDVAAIMNVSDGFFVDGDEVRAYLEQGGVLLLEDVAGALLAVGIFKPVIEGRVDVDVGMVTAPAHRGRGFGTAVVAAVKAACIARGLHPVCGCAADNVASRRALERAGFVAEHRLLTIEAWRSR
jgi:GNAT superfamily N-acetyltransferase